MEASLELASEHQPELRGQKQTTPGGKETALTALAATSGALQVIQDLKVGQVGAKRPCSRHQVTPYCGSERSELPEDRSLLGPAVKRQTEASE